MAVTGSGANYEISVTGTPTNGTIIFSIAASEALDAAGNNNAASTSTDNSVTYDTVAPTLSSLEMFDTNANGKIDQVKATFNETLAAYTAPNSLWTLANVPSAGSLAASFGTCTGGTTSGGVCVQGAVATLLITEGAGAANTAVGTFTVALGASATGIRDAAGNQSTFAATGPADKAGPVPVALAETNGATDGKFEAGDTMTVTFSEVVIGVAATSNVSLEGGSGSNADKLTMPNFLNGTATLSKPPAADYINNNKDAAFNSSALSQPATNQVRVTLGTCSLDCADLTTASAVGNFTYVPATVITDAATNPAAGSITVSIKLF